MRAFVPRCPSSVYPRRRRHICMGLKTPAPGHLCLPLLYRYHLHGSKAASSACLLSLTLSLAPYRCRADFRTIDLVLCLARCRLLQVCAPRLAPAPSPSPSLASFLARSFALLPPPPPHKLSWSVSFAFRLAVSLGRSFADWHSSLPLPNPRPPPSLLRQPPPESGLPGKISRIKA